MDDFHSRPGVPRRLFDPMMRFKVDPSYKVDEGYSEDTRSQDDVESPVKMDAGEESMMSAPLPLGVSLQEAALGLSEMDRSGKPLGLCRS